MAELARGDRVFLFAVARVGAGVDLEKLAPESFIVDNEAGTVLVRLPAPEVFYSYLDNEATQVLDRDTGLLTKGDAQLESEARREAERLLVNLSLDEGILDQAQENAETTISNFLHGLGYTHVMIERSPAPSIRTATWSPTRRPPGGIGMHRGRGTISVRVIAA